jgi:type IV pilus assembly protein PilC
LLEAREGGEVSEKAEHSVSRIKAKRRDVIAFFIQMSLLLRAGITLPHGLERMTEDFKGTRMGAVSAGLSEQVSVGTPLNRAMATFPRVFSKQVLAMVQAGEVSGRLPEVFQSLSAYFEWMDGLVAEVRQALIYPVIVLMAASALVAMLFTFIVPKFVGLLNDLSLEIPLLTRVVMGISDFFVHFWPLIFGAAIAVPIALKFALRVPAFGRIFDRKLMDIPVFGSLVSMFGVSRFAQNLAMLYRSGIALLNGLEICRGLVGNRAIEFALEDVRQTVLEGTPMSKGMSKHDVFPSTLVTMVATGEASGTLDEALQGVADYYNTLIPRRIKAVFAIFNPAVMLALIGVVGVVALAVILPILQLWQV